MCLICEGRFSLAMGEDRSSRCSKLDWEGEGVMNKKSETVGMDDG